MLICPVCGKLNAEGSSNCDLCGAPVATAEHRVPVPQAGQHAPEGASGPVCPVCKRTNRSISVFCAFCGYRLSTAASPQPYALPNANGNRDQGRQGAPPSRPPSPPAIPSNEAGNIPSGTVLKRRYRIMRKIAQGGMGAVYESSDLTASTGTRWAVKEMSPAERRAFLAHGTRTGKLATSRRDGQPHAAPDFLTFLDF